MVKLFGQAASVRSRLRFAAGAEAARRVGQSCFSHVIPARISIEMILAPDCTAQKARAKKVGKQH
jgi:hypothetical protein